MYQFIFAAIRRTDLTNHIQKIRINADSEQQARAVLAREFVLILAGKINLQNARTFSPEQNHSLQSFVMMGSICGTTTNEGNRNPYLCGIFLSQIYTSQGEQRPKSIEFAVRATRGNKALCTNNTGYSFVAVEPLSLPTKGDNSLLTKQTRQFKMKPFQTPSGNTAPSVSIALSLSEMGVKND
ncbi:hypothetical protein BKG95_00665 [Rodentibacter pneumotropicus]|uniref:host cell division inhibitor Icd-like protein n=1 Tax=Rodentibacter pneumotropicus TaxID=758 RepID=UPI000989676D|nr:host cell division inhibitor Icd-like protein [Rodentibacter pneumotropicus]OOF68814.1 hypothetical protein BKG95_00665 [Rodentibacter pneumotropicus]